MAATIVRLVMPARHPTDVESLKLVGDPVVFLHSDRVHYAQVKCVRGLNAYKDWHHKFLPRLAIISSKRNDFIIHFMRRYLYI